MHRPRMETNALIAALAGLFPDLPTMQPVRHFGTPVVPGPGLRLRRPSVDRYPASVARAKGWAWVGDGVPSKVKPAKAHTRTR